MPRSPHWVHSLKRCLQLKMRWWLDILEMKDRVYIEGLANGIEIESSKDDQGRLFIIEFKKYKLNYFSRYWRIDQGIIWLNTNW